MNDAARRVALPLADGVRARFVPDVNGLHMHLLEAGDARRPGVLLLHGFPELAYSWRKLMPLLAAAGYHVIAPDQRGYGRTTGWDAAYDTDLSAFGMANLVADAGALLAALGKPTVAAVVGHDFGSPVAAWCALMHPETYRAVALMSAPFAGAPPHAATVAQQDDALRQTLAALQPPRKHYQHHYASREANADLLQPAQGLPALLRAYYHCKSADYRANRPVELAGVEAIAELPRYYVMDLDRNMAQTVAAMAPSLQELPECRWLTDAELAVYAAEFGRTGFQGGLNWYRCASDAGCLAPLHRWRGKRIEVPACFIAGAADWGMHQRPGALQRMRGSACADFRGVQVVNGAGHWVQQEQPEVTAALLLDFLKDAA